LVQPRGKDASHRVPVDGLEEPTVVAQPQQGGGSCDLDGGAIRRPGPSRARVPARGEPGSGMYAAMGRGGSSWIGSPFSSVPGSSFGLGG
jgi:hypothetical protein